MDNIKIYSSCVLLILLLLISPGINAQENKDSTVKIPIILLPDDDNSDDDGSQIISSLLSSSRDVFVSNTGFNFYPARFRMRGYRNEYSNTMVNGVTLNDMESGYPNWSLFSGLNDGFRLRTTKFGLEPNTDFGFTGIAANNNINIRAGDQRKQLRVSQAFSNRSYALRTMVNYNTGWMKNNWAFSFTGSGRYANRGYVKGTYYQGLSYALGLQRKLNKNHILGLNFFGAPTERAKAGPATLEAMELAGTHYYNPYWGLHNGKIRNSRIAKSNQPVLILTHDWKVNKNTKITNTVSYIFGRYGSTGFDWFNAGNPGPDYYYRLPSYYGTNTTVGQLLAKQFSENEDVRQMDWAKLYEDNEANVVTVNGITGKKAVYVLNERRGYTKNFAFNSRINKSYSQKKLTLSGGITANIYSKNSFKIVTDLMGADFLMNHNSFVDASVNPNYLYNDLDNKDALLKEGDRFGYDYTAMVNKVQAWGHAFKKYRKFDVYYSGKIGGVSMQRRGNVTNGIFPTNSKGLSDKVDFITYGLKVGAYYKFNAKKYILLAGSYLNEAPNWRNSFISPNSRNLVVPNLKAEKILSGEVAHIYKSNKLKSKIGLYATQINDRTRIARFYSGFTASSTGTGNAFANYVMSGINEMHAGIEAAAEYKITSAFAVTGLLGLGNYYYTANPKALIVEENTPKILDKDREVFLKNYMVEGTPQNIYSMIFSYRSPKYWFANISLNGYSHNYLSMNPERHTLRAMDNVSNPDVKKQILATEKLPAGFYVSLFAGKSWKIKKNFIYLNVGINNVLNNTNLLTGGFQQYRFEPNGDASDVNKFANKYFYMYGANYFINLTYKI